MGGVRAGGRARGGGIQYSEMSLAAFNEYCGVDHKKNKLHKNHLTNAPTPSANMHQKQRNEKIVTQNQTPTEATAHG